VTPPRFPLAPRGEGARRAGEGAGGTIADRDLELSNYSAASSMSATPSITPTRAG
jgi:hypothetical protein